MGARRSKGRKKRNSYHRLVRQYKHAKAAYEAEIELKIRRDATYQEARNNYMASLSQLRKAKGHFARCEFSSCPYITGDVCQSPAEIKHDGFGRCLVALMCLEEDDDEKIDNVRAPSLEGAAVKETGRGSAEETGTKNGDGAAAHSHTAGDDEG